MATTAGGAKLLRVYALYKHGLRELERLVHPHSVGGSGGEARHLRRRGAYMAWLFFMLMALSLALVMAAFALTGSAFEEALVLAVAGLTTTGPLAADRRVPADRLRRAQHLGQGGADRGDDLRTAGNARDRGAVLARAVAPVAAGRRGGRRAGRRSGTRAPSRAKNGGGNFPHARYILTLLSIFCRDPAARENKGKKRWLPTSRTCRTHS